MRKPEERVKKMNTAEQIELRRKESALRSLGAGVIAFTLWTGLKVTLVIFLVPNEEQRAAFDALGLLGWVIGLLVVLLTVLLVSAPQLWVGLSARAEAAGRRKGAAYLIVGLLLFFGEASATATGLWQLFHPNAAERSVLEAAASLLMQGSYMAILGDMLLTAIKVKRLRRETD